MNTAAQISVPVTAFTSWVCLSPGVELRGHMVGSSVLTFLRNLIVVVSISFLLLPFLCTDSMPSKNCSYLVTPLYTLLFIFT